MKPKSTPTFETLERKLEELLALWSAALLGDDLMKPKSSPTIETLDAKLKELLALAERVPDGLAYLVGRLAASGMEVPELRKRLQDDAVEEFRKACLWLTQAPYIVTPADMVNLARLRKGYGLAVGTCPPDWEAAIENYFQSPLSKYSLADLCVRYTIFHNSPVDRYGKPVNHSGSYADGQTKAGRNLQEARKLRAQLDSQTRERSKRGTQRGDSGGLFEPPDSDES